MEDTDDIKKAERRGYSNGGYIALKMARILAIKHKASSEHMEAIERELERFREASAIP